MAAKRPANSLERLFRWPFLQAWKLYGFHQDGLQLGALVQRADVFF
jgi:predicted NAD/FAD-binding protein